MSSDRHQPTQQELFSGGGELGERMARIAWAETPLGPVEGWPQSLKTCVRIVLTSRQPMFVWWGDALINLYNDAYRSILGGKHPGALGQPASVVWREIWDAVAPRAAAAMKENVGTYDEALLLIMERHGYPEETYYTFSYSPVPNDQGGIGGILCANTDDTQRIIGERQVATLRELAARSADARSWQEACRLAAQALGQNGRDLPFSAVYLVADDRRRATLAATSGIDGGHPGAPEQIALADAAPYPIAEVIERHATTSVELGREHGSLPAGAWTLPPKRAALVPIASSGPSGRAGVLVVGLSPFRLFDDGYRGFLELVAGQIGASIANAEAYEHEKRRAEALAEIDRAKTAFFSNVSHEFRTPLTLMLGPTEDALGSPSGALSGAALQTVYRNELRLLRLVNALLDFARVEAGRINAIFEPVDLARLTGDLASLFRSAIERAGLRFEVHCERELPDVYVDREMWEKIVLNLLSNALKFTFEGSIGVDLADAGDGVVLTVRDTGVGVAPEQLPRLFERFHRIEGVQARTHEGSGIGLALVSELVKLHGGAVSVESELGRGSAFRVSLRKGRAHLPEERIGLRHELTTELREAFAHEALRWTGAESELPVAVPAPSGVLPTEPGSANKRILLADDNADIREYVGGLLRQHWLVETAADGLEALARARAAPPDLVLTDVMMPRLDGFGLLRELRADDATRSIPVVMLSARAGEESRVEGLQAGADDYLVKPFSARELIARVRTHLQLASLRSAAEQRMSEALKNQERLRAALNASRVGTYFWDPKHDAVERDAGVKAIFGFEGEQGERLEDYAARVHPDDRAAWLAGVERCLRDGDDFEQQYRVVWPDGSVHWVRDKATMSKDEAGAPQHLAGALVDLTEVKELQEREQAARGRAEEASRAKDEFLAMLGHELRNPLSPIVTALQIMKLRGDTRATKELKVIERQVNHLVRLVDDLLDVARITRGKVELRREPVQIADVAAKAVEMASPLFEQRRHELVVDVAREGLRVDADPVRLAQVISNLLTNAARYTEPGGRVELSGRRERDDVVIRVKDNGTGISPELLPRVFDLFFQGRQGLDRSEGGLGLGLALVRSLVRMHGGEVTAQSAGRGKGSEFVIHLRALDEPGDGVALSEEGSTRSSAPPQGTGRRVLIVDDNQDAAEMLGFMLREVGHDVAIAHDGPEALRLAARFQPDVAVLDIGLPVMDGYELASRLRQSSGARACKLIALTGYGQDHDRARSRDAGFDAHLVKPVKVAVLLDAIKS